MTTGEKLDFAALRAEMRDGFLRLEGKLDTLATRVVFLETAKAITDDRETAKRSRARGRSQLIATFVAIAGALYGAARLAHDLWQVF